MRGKFELLTGYPITIYGLQRLINSFGVFLFLLFFFYVASKRLAIIPRYTDIQKLSQFQHYALVGSAPRNDALKIPVLMYHYVEHVEDQSDTMRKSLNIVPEVFEQQIITLKQAGYSFITMKDIGEILDGKKVPREKLVVLTFDDGYRDFYTNVYPLLKKHSVVATQYLVAGFTGLPNYMTHEQIAEIQQSGLVDFGAHTVNHINLHGKNREEVMREILDGKKILEQEFNFSVRSFAYPYGSYDQQAVEITSNGSYSTAVTTVKGVHEELGNRYTIPRLRPGNNVGKDLVKLLHQP